MFSVMSDISSTGGMWRMLIKLGNRRQLYAIFPRYQPSPENLVVNGDFSLPVLNGGFDWLYEKSSDVSLALDATELHSGQRSLSIVFDSRGIDDIGIRQLIPVEPNTTYEFSAYFKSQGLMGAGGPRFLLADRFTGANYFASDELKDAEFWKQVRGNI